MRKTLQTLVAAAWFGLAGVLVPHKSAAQGGQEGLRYELKNEDTMLMHTGTLPGAIGKKVENAILEMTKYEVERSVFGDAKMKLEKAGDLAAQLVPGFGKVMLPHSDGTKKPECVVYLFFDDNKDEIFNTSANIRPEVQEHGLFAIPNNVYPPPDDSTLADVPKMLNAPYIDACDEYSTLYEKLFGYKLFEIIRGTNYFGRMSKRFHKSQYSDEEWERMKRCVVAKASFGILENKESLELITEGSKIIDGEFAKWFGSLEKPQPHPNAELLVFRIVGFTHVYTILFIDNNKNGEPDEKESVLTVIKDDQMITSYVNSCGFEPTPKAQPAEIKAPPPETKALEKSKTLKERLTELGKKKAELKESGKERKENNEEGLAVKGRKDKSTPMLRLYPSIYGTYVDKNQFHNLPLLWDITFLLPHQDYIQLGQEARFEWVPFLRNVVFHDQKFGIDRLADYENNNGTGGMMSESLDIIIGIHLAHWLAINARAGFGGYGFDTDSNTGDKAYMSYFSGYLGAGTKVRLFEKMVVLSLDAEYVRGGVMEGASYTKEGKWNIRPGTVVDGRRIDSGIVEGTIETALSLPDQRHPNARVHLSYLNDIGFFLQLVALSKGANVSPMCEVFSCSGMYGRTSTGGRIGWLLKVGDQVYITGALEGRVETSGIDQFYNYQNVPMGGISVGLIIMPSENEPVQALLLPEMR